VTLVLEGMLDAAGGEALLSTVHRALQAQPERIDIDLRVVTSFVREGAMALARCRDVCGGLPAGLHYRTDGGPGQLALLTAFEYEPVVDHID